MNPVLISVMRIIRDLLDYPEELIQQGRLNEDRTDFDTGYIVVDTLAPGQPQATGQRYNGDTEKLTLSARVRQPITVDFYGLNAYTNAQQLQLLLKSDKAYELQRTHGVTMGSFQQITDVKALTGQQYGNRYQAELVINYSPSVTLDVLRIDTAVIETTVN